MKCPKCGVSNGKTNKFCRECGHNIGSLAQSAEMFDTPDLENDLGHLDELELGEELFSVMKIYDDGDLKTAEKRARKIIESYPESASALSIMGLIYERKADIETEEGNFSSAHGHLQLAVSQYEAIVELNPKSGADREKLVALRMKILGRTSPTTNSPSPKSIITPSAIWAEAKGLLKKVPTPALVATGAFFVLFIACSALIPRGGKSIVRVTEQRPPQSVNGLQETTSTGTLSQPSSPANASTGLKVYNYPTAPVAPPMKPVQASTPPKLPRAVEPMTVPDVGPELVMVPVPRRANTTAKIKALPAPTAESVEITPSRADGSTLLARAINLSNQEKYAEAIGTAQQAVSLFQSDLAAGNNVSSARRGLDNANKSIQLWRSMETP